VRKTSANTAAREHVLIHGNLLTIIIILPRESSCGRRNVNGEPRNFFPQGHRNACEVDYALSTIITKSGHLNYLNGAKSKK
jgi:hypothetical protein